MKISKILSYVVLLVGIITAVLIYVMSSNISDAMVERETDEAISLPLEVSAPLVSPLYNLAIGIIVILLIVTVISVIGGLIKNPASLGKTLIGIVAFLAVLGLSYALASDFIPPLSGDNTVTPGTAKLAGAGIYAFYILTIIAIGAMIVAGIKKAIS